MIREPSTKINWEELLDETKVLIKDTWPEVANEYISRYCEDVKLINPFTREEIKLGTMSKTPPKVETETGDVDYGAWYED